MALAGAAIGPTAALGRMRPLSGMLFVVSAHDPLTFFGVADLFVVVALAACYVPARPAARVDPGWRCARNEGAGLRCGRGQPALAVLLSRRRTSIYWGALRARPVARGD